jgi:hypothetical protein
LAVAVLVEFDAEVVAVPGGTGHLSWGKILVVALPQKVKCQ